MKTIIENRTGDAIEVVIEPTGEGKLLNENHSKEILISKQGNGDDIRFLISKNNDNNRIVLTVYDENLSFGDFDFIE